MGEAWIIDAVRTPRGRGKKDGALAAIHPQELMAQALNALKDRNQVNPLDVEDVLVGCVTAYGEQAMCIARMSVLAAGMAERLNRRDDQPFLRVGPAGGELRGDGHQVRRTRSGRRWRR